MKKSLLFCIVAMAVVWPYSAASLRAQDSAEGITVSASQISEYRHAYLNDPTKKSSSYSNYLTITLKFKGDGVKKLTRIGQWKTTTAKDDLGTNVERTSSFTSSTLSRTYRRYNAYSKEQPPQDEYETSYSLNLPKRSATKLAVFSGEVRLALSDIDSVSIPVSKLKEMSGKIIADPLLKKAGLTVTLERFTPTATSASTAIKFTGEKNDREKLLRVRFEEKDGRIISESNTYSGFSYGSGSVYAYRKVPDDAFLKLDIETKRKDVIVRFDLKNISLP